MRVFRTLTERRRRQWSPAHLDRAVESASELLQPGGPYQRRSGHLHRYLVQTIAEVASSILATPIRSTIGERRVFRGFRTECGTASGFDLPKSARSCADLPHSMGTLWAPRWAASYPLRAFYNSSFKCRSDPAPEPICNYRLPSPDVKPAAEPRHDACDNERHVHENCNDYEFTSATS